jgi:hypothetical protein
MNTDRIIDARHAKKLQSEVEHLKSQLTQTQGCVTISRNGYVQELERELDEAREIIAAALKALPVGYLPAHTPESIPARIEDLCKTIVETERERDEARAELIRWQSIAAGRGRTDECNDSDTPRTDHVVKKSDQKDAEMAFAIMTDHADCLERELAAVTAQRDRLVEALEIAANRFRHPEFGCNWEDASKEIESTLQSLTPNEEP